MPNGRMAKSYCKIDENGRAYSIEQSKLSGKYEFSIITQREREREKNKTTTIHNMKSYRWKTLMIKRGAIFTFLFCFIL